MAATCKYLNRFDEVRGKRRGAQLRSQHEWTDGHQLERLQLPVPAEDVPLQAVGAASGVPPGRHHAVAEPYPHLGGGAAQLHYQHRGDGLGVLNSCYRRFQDGIRIGISVCLMILWVPLALYTFYLGYMLLMKNEGSRFIFYLLSFITFVFFGIWSIADFADANGFVRMGNLFKADKGGAGVLALINSIVSLAISGLAVVNAIIVFRANR